jgi:hypothetical protein
MSLEERALEILREEDEDMDSELSEDDVLVVEDDIVEDDSDAEDDGRCVKEPEESIPLREDKDVDDEDDDIDDVDDLYTMNLKMRYSEPLKGTPYIRKHDDVLCIDVTSNIYYTRE